MNAAIPVRAVIAFRYLDVMKRMNERLPRQKDSRIIRLTIRSLAVSGPGSLHVDLDL